MADRRTRRALLGIATVGFVGTLTGCANPDDDGDDDGGDDRGPY